MKKHVKELLDIDKAFCERTQQDKEEAWEHFLSKKAIMGTLKHEPYLQSKSQIVHLIQMIYQLDNLSFTWEPKHAFISEDKTLGVTTGTYKRKYQIEHEIIEEIGKYTTVWEKEGLQWKIVFDMGN